MKIRIQSLLRQPLWLVRSLGRTIGSARWEAYSLGSPRHRVQGGQLLEERSLLSATLPDLAAPASQTELVIVDGRVEDSTRLVEDLQRQQAQGRPIEIVHLAADQDGIDVISQVLATERNLKAIHIISHGADGLVQLGNTTLDLGTLRGNRGREIEHWGQALAEGGDLLLYGCSVAESSAGKAFVHRLSQQIRAGVAASDDLTGAAGLGGDWSLEYADGQIDVESLFARQDPQWGGVLSTVVHSYEGPAFNALRDEEVRSNRDVGQSFRFNSPAAIYSVNQVSLVMFRDASIPAQSLSVSIRSSWNGATIASGTLDASLLNTAAGWTTIDLSTTATLNRNTTYFIRVTTSSNAANKVFVGSDDTSSYADGNQIDLNGNIVAGADLPFRLMLGTPNTPPMITSNGGAATASLSVPENGTAVTTVTASDADTPAQTINYSITGGSDAARFAINAATGQLTFVAPPNFESPTDSNGDNVYQVTVQASDGNGGTDTQTLNVTVTNVNEAPTAIAISNASVSEAAADGSTVGTLSRTDADAGDTATYALLDSAGGRFALSPAGVLTVARTDLLDFEEATSHVISVRVTDAGGLTYTQNLTISVTNADDPVARVPFGTLYAVAGEPLEIPVNSQFSDPQNRSITYAVSGLPTGLSYNAASGVIQGTLPAGIPAGGSYPLSIRATNSAGLAETFFLNLVVRQPTSGSTSGAWTISGSGNAATGTASLGNGVTVSSSFTANSGAAWSSTGNGSLNTIPAFGLAARQGRPSLSTQFAWDTTPGNSTEQASLDAATGRLRFTFNRAVTNPILYLDRLGGHGNFITNSVALRVLTAGVTLQQVAGTKHLEVDPATGTIQRTVNTQQNNRPSVNESTIDPLEGTAAGAVMLLGTFTTVEFEAAVAADSIEGAGADGFEVAWEVNAAPVAAADNVSTNEDVSLNRLAAAGLLANDTDGDGNPLSLTQFTVAGVGGTFAPGSTVTFAGLGSLTIQADGSYSFIPVANAFGTAPAVTYTITDGTHAVTGVLNLTVNSVNDAPQITGLSANTVAENSPNGTVVGTVGSSDVDANDTATYSLSNNAGGRFTIHPQTGVITVANGTLLDFEANASHGITVVVTDSGGATASQAYTIQLTNVNEAPVITSNGAGATANVSIPERSTGVTTVTATDVDANTTLGYSIVGGADAARFAINPATGALSFQVAPNFSAPADANLDNVYEVTVQVSDGMGGIDQQAIRVTVTNINDAPVITSDGGGGVAEFTLPENTPVVTTVAATDPDPNTTLTYTLSGGTDLARFTINPATGVLSFVAPPNFESPADSNGDNVYQVIVRVSDGVLSDTQTITVQVTNLNEAPVITSNGGGATASVSVPENTTFVATVAATDQDAGATVSYSISGGADAARFAINPVTGVLTLLAPPNFESPSDANGDNVYEVTVQASDGSLVDTQALQVAVTNVNEAPQITSDGGLATASLSVPENTTAVTTVIAADPDAGGTLTYTLNGGADVARFVLNSSTGMLSFLAAPNFEAPTDANFDNLYVVTVRVTDGTLTDTQTITVQVTNANDAPVISSNGGGATAGVTIAENATAITTVTASDPDGSSGLSYSISGGADAARFAINPATGVLTLVAPPNFESPADANGDNVYEVTVQASDGALVDTQALQVTVTNVNEAPHITSDGGGPLALLSMPEGLTAVTTVTAVDPDANPTIIYTISGLDAARFAINSATGVLRFLAAPSFETPTDSNQDNVYEVVVRAGDATVFTTQTIRVTVANANDAPSNITFSVAPIPENSPGGTPVGAALATDPEGDAITYSLHNSAGGRFEIDPQTGAIRVAAGAVLDFESTPTLTLTVRATDSQGAFLDRDVIVSLTNVNEAPTDLTLSSNGVPENSTLGTPIGTVVRTDPDAGDPGRFSLVNDAGGRFMINAQTGALSVANGRLLDFEASRSHTIVVRVTDGGGLSFDKTLTIQLTNVNEAPTEVLLSGTTVEENAASGTVIGRATRVDPDLGDAELYTLTNDAGGRFAIHPTTGELRVASGSLLDFETNRSHPITIRLTDSGGLFVERSFVITVGNVNEAPTSVSFTGTSVPENSPAGRLVGTASRVDPDVGDAAVYSLVDDAGGRFTINPTSGVVTVANGSLLDFEAGGSHAITIRASDRMGLSRDAVFTVQVTNVNEAPTDLTLSNATLREDAANGALVGVVTRTDPDAGDTALYSLVNNAGGRFAINPATGAVTLVNRSLINFETAASHAVTVRVSDAGGMAVTRSFTIQVQNVNEAPGEILLSASTVGENAANGTVIGNLGATDPDAGDAFTYTLLDDAGGRFAIDPQGNRLVVADGARLDFEAARSHEVVVRVTDAAGATLERTFTVALGDVNEAPTDLRLDRALVFRNATQGATVGTVSAVDADAGDGAVYRLIDSAGGRFAINAATGVLTVANAGLIAADAESSRTVQVRVTDSGGLSFTKALTVQIGTGGNSRLRPIQWVPATGTLTITSGGGGSNVIVQQRDGDSGTVDVLDEGGVQSFRAFVGQLRKIVFVGDAAQDALRVNLSVGPTLSIDLFNVERFGINSNTTLQSVLVTDSDNTTDLFLMDLFLPRAGISISSNNQITQLASTAAVVAGPASFTTTNGRVLLDQANYFGGPVSVTSARGGDVVIRNQQPLTLAGVSAAGNLSVSASGQVLQSAGGRLNVTGRTDVQTGNGRINLDGANQLRGAVSLRNTGPHDIALNVAGDVTLDAVRTTRGGFNVTATGAIAQAAGGALRVGQSTRLFAGGNITAANDNDLAGAVELRSAAAGGTVRLNDRADLLLAGVNVAGNLVLSSGGSVAQVLASSLAVNGTTSVTANGSISLDASNRFQGAVSLASGNGSLALNSAQGLVLGNLTTRAGDLRVTAGGNVTQAAGSRLNVTGNTAIGTGGGSITLDQLNNRFAGGLDLSSADRGNVTLRSGGPLAMGNITVGRGSLDVSTVGDLTQLAGGSLSVSGQASFTAVNGSVTLDRGNFFNDAVSLTATGGGSVRVDSDRSVRLGNVSVAGSGSLAVTALGNVTQATTGTITVGGAARVHADGGAILLNRPNRFGGAVSLSNNGTGDVALSNNQALLLGDVSVPLGNLSLSAAGNITQQAGTVIESGGTLTLQAAGVVRLDQANLLRGTVNLTAAGTQESALRNDRDLTLGSGTLAGGLRVSAGGGIRQAPAGVLNVAGRTTLEAGNGAIALTGRNQLTELTATQSGGGGISVSNNRSLSLGNLTAAGELSLAVAGNLTQTSNSALNVAGPAAVSSLCGSVTLTGANRFGGPLSVSVTGAGNATVQAAGALTLGASTLGTGTLSVTAQGDLTQAANTALNLTGAGSFTSAAGGVSLSQANRFGGPLSLRTAGGRDAFVNATQSLNLASVEVGGNLAVSAIGAVGQAPLGSVRVQGATSLATLGGAINLNGGTNQFNGTLSASATGTAGVTLRSAGAMRLGNVTLGTGNLAVAAGGAISQQANTTLAVGGATVMNATGGSIVLNQANQLTGQVSLGTTGLLNNVTLVNNQTTNLGNVQSQGVVGVRALQGNIVRVRGTTIVSLGTPQLLAVQGRVI